MVRCSCGGGAGEGDGDGDGEVGAAARLPDAASSFGCEDIMGCAVGCIVWASKRAEEQTRQFESPELARNRTLQPVVPVGATLLAGT